MTTEEVLLTVLTVAIVILIIVVIAVLAMVLKIARKVNHVTDQVQQITNKGARVAEALTPVSIATLGMVRAMKILVKRR
jgi:cell division protein FtsL